MATIADTPHFVLGTIADSGETFNHVPDSADVSEDAPEPLTVKHTVKLKTEAKTRNIDDENPEFPQGEDSEVAPNPNLASDAEYKVQESA